MHNVFLVDDEIVVREGIRNNIPWDEIPFNLAGEAPDGEMALSMMQDLKPDILITDIRMPFLDGLELARIIRKTQPWVKIIILSGHDEFRYAREAISIGVEEYLLKPFSSAELLEVLRKVAAQIEKEREDLISLENLKSQVLSSRDVMRERWLRELAAGLVSPADAIEQARSHGLDLIAGAYVAAVVKLTPPEGRNRELLSARVLMKSHLARRNDVIFFSERPERHVLIAKQLGEEPPEDTAYSLAQGLKYEIAKNTGCRLSVAIGHSVRRIGEISASYESADSVSRFMAERGQQLILGIRDMGGTTAGEIDLFPEGVNQIAGRLKYAAAAEIDEMMEDYEALLDSRDGHSDFFCNYLLGDIIMASTRIIVELGGDVHQVIPSFLQREKLNSMVNSRENFRLHMRELIEKVVLFRESMGKGRHSEMIRKAQDYIESHFADPDICLHSVAGFVNVSPNHFSTVYSQETGQNFIEYLTSVRIEEAKNLLRNTDLRSADIAYEAGFNDPHYFSFIFKKNVGVSPREFRAERVVHS